MHSICFFPSASPFLHPAFFGPIQSGLVETEVSEMLSSHKFCGNGWSGRSKTQTGARLGEERQSLPPLSVWQQPASSLAALYSGMGAGGGAGMLAVLWAHRVPGNTAERGLRERDGFVGREASICLLLYCSENSFATVQHSHKATGLI